MAEGKEFFHESVQDASSVQDLLQALQEAMAQQRIVLSAQGQEMILTPTSLLHLSIRGSRKGVSNKLEIKIVWEDRAVSESEQDSGLSISSS
jgi:amphi-Trp domain-containing protein